MAKPATAPLVSALVESLGSSSKPHQGRTKDACAHEEQPRHLPTGGTAVTELDFNKADFGAPAAGVVCASCPSKIRDRYFEINGATVCTNCRRLIAELERPEGGLKRFVLATVLGVMGGAVGAALWYAVARLFNLEIGLIAILVGWLVGTGVHKGAEGRGGWRYQLLAAFLTYASIVTTYIPPIYAELSKGPEAAVSSPAGSGDGGASKPPAAEAPATAPVPVAAPAEGGAGEPVSLTRALGALALAGVLLYAIAFAAPFLMGVENLIGILIIGFAVHQAWRMNARRVLEIKGPFRVAPPASPAPVVSTPGDPASR